MPYVDRRHRLEYLRRYRLTNPDLRTYSDRAESQRKAQNRNREYLRRIKESKPCHDCGVSYPYFVMDFDHCSGVKDSDVSRMILGRFSLARIQKEIDKCELVCANCHRFRTHRRANGLPHLDGAE